MKELEPPRRVGEIAHYEEDPFDLGDMDEKELVVVQDFLPSPEELVFKEPETEKITSHAEQGHVDLFPREGARTRCALPAYDP